MQGSRFIEVGCFFFPFTLHWAGDVNEHNIHALRMMQDRNLIRRANGNLIAARRRLTGLTQENLANAMGVTREVVANFELGRQEVFMDQVFVLAEILGSKPEDMLADIKTIGTESISSIAPDGLSLSEQELYRLMLAKPGAYLASHESEASKP
jgi:transcriptional regulator with XRE-family HTH domain